MISYLFSDYSIFGIFKTKYDLPRNQFSSIRRSTWPCTVLSNCFIVQSSNNCEQRIGGRDDSVRVLEQRYSIRRKNENEIKLENESYFQNQNYLRNGLLSLRNFTPCSFVQHKLTIQPILMFFRMHMKVYQDTGLQLKE